MLLHASPRLGRRAARLTAGIAAMAAVLAVGVPAQAQVVVPICETPGHTYLTQPGRAYFSGYDGDQKFGIPTIVASQGEYFRVGGNGVLPRTNIKFEAASPPGPGQTTGTRIDFLPGIRTYFTHPARENCVVHEEGPYRLTAPPGRYRIFSNYVPGNQRQRGEIFEVVADLQVLPGLPSPFSTSSLDAAESSNTAALVAPNAPAPSPGPDPEPQPDPGPGPILY